MSKRYRTISINAVEFELDTKETVDNPVVFYKSVYDVYGRCSDAKKSIWESWANWFNQANSHMYGVTSHNSNFFTISGCVTWMLDNKPTELFVVITKGHQRAWVVKRS